MVKRVWLFVGGEVIGPEEIYTANRQKGPRQRGGVF